MKAMKDSELALVGGAYNPTFPEPNQPPLFPPSNGPWLPPVGAPYPFPQPSDVPYGP